MSAFIFMISSLLLTLDLFALLFLVLLSIRLGCLSEVSHLFIEVGLYCYTFPLGLI